MKDKDDQIDYLESRGVEMMERQKDLFSPRARSELSHSLPDSGNWKGIADRYAE